MDGGTATLELAVVGIRFFLGFLLIAAALPKLADRKRFASALAEYRVLPGSLINRSATAVPIAEVAVGSALIFGITLPVAATVAAALFAAFAVAVSVNLALNKRVDCGCGIGGGSRPLSWILVAEDVLLCVLSVWLAGAAGSPLTAWPAAESSLVSRADGLAMAVVAGAVLLGGLILGQLRLWGLSRQSASISQ